jgi:hypothetical protein
MVPPDRDPSLGDDADQLSSEAPDLRGDGLHLAHRPTPPPPPADAVIPVTPGEFHALWARAQEMVARGGLALLDLQLAAEADAPHKAGTLLWEAYDYLNADQLPPRPDLHLDASVWLERLDEVVRACWAKHPHKRPTADEVGLALYGHDYSPQDMGYGDREAQREACGKRLERHIRKHLKCTWRAYLNTVPPP